MTYILYLHTEQPACQLALRPYHLNPMHIRQILLQNSRVGVSKASVFHFVSRTVCSLFPTLNLRRPSFSSCRCMDLERSSTAYHICSVTSRLLLSLKTCFFELCYP